LTYKKYYYLDIPASFSGGKVVSSTSNPYLAVAGQTVTLTITPDACYELVSIYVYLYGTTTPIPLTDPRQTRSGGAVQTCTFTMPVDHITVAAVFDLIGRTSVEDVKDNRAFRAYAENGILYVCGLSPTPQKSPSSLRIYTMVYQGVINGDSAEIALPGRGVYIVTDGTKVVKVAN